MSVFIDGSVPNNGHVIVNSVAAIAAIQNLTRGTIAFRFRIDDNSTFRRLFVASCIDDPSSDLFIMYDSGSDDIELRVREAAANFILWNSDTNIADDGNWHSFVFTVGTGSNEMYFDGVHDAGTYTTGNAATQEFFNRVLDIDVVLYGIGQDSGGFEFPLDGAMEECAIWSEQLTAAEVFQYHNSGVKGIPLQLQPQNLVYYHPLDDVADGVSAVSKSFIDMSGNNFTATGSTATIIGEAGTQLSYQPYIMPVESIAAAAPPAAFIAERGPFRGINRGINRGVA